MLYDGKSQQASVAPLAIPAFILLAIFAKFVGFFVGAYVSTQTHRILTQAINHNKRK